MTRVLAVPVLLLGLGVVAGPLRAESDRFPSRDHIELVRMWKLVETLQIDEAQAMKVFPAFRRYYDRQQELQAARRERLRALEQSLETDAGDAELRQAIDRVRAADAELHQLDTAFEEQVTDLLSVRQQAQMLLFEGTFRGELRDLVRRMRLGDGDRKRRSED